MAHSPRVKAAAVAMLLQGHTPRWIARELNLPRTTIRRWQQELRENGPKKRGEPVTLDSRVEDLVRLQLETARIYLRELRDPDRLRELNAREMAELHGNLWDRAFRLMPFVTGGDTVLVEVSDR